MVFRRAIGGYGPSCRTALRTCSREDHPVAERQAVGRLQVLHDLVRVQHEVAGQRQHRRQQAPGPLGVRLRVQQPVERGAHPASRWLWRV